jgi:hypothetical protein
MNCLERTVPFFSLVIFEDETLQQRLRSDTDANVL